MLSWQVSGVSDQLCRSIKVELTQIEQKQDRGKIVQTVEANQDQKDPAISHCFAIVSIVFFM